MANIDSLSILNSTGGINAAEVGEMSSNNSNEPSHLSSFSSEKLLSLTDNVMDINVSPHDVVSLTSTVDEVALNDSGASHYIAQELPQASNNVLGAFAPTEFDFHSVNNENEGQPSFVGSSNSFNVPNQADTENNQMYMYEDVMKVGGIVNKVPQTAMHAVFSLNPTKVVQSGQQDPLQTLTQEQLNELLRLVQQNNTSSGAQEAMFYDPVSQQKTVYKICYANQQIGNTNSNYTAGASVSTVREVAKVNTSHQLKRNQIEAADVLLKMDKEHKKKHRPRTRSGRVSKPPQYMVKDYKHIHPVDYDEDYDDSDGGYSDFKQSSGEEESKNNVGDNPKAYGKANASLKSKRFKCEYCEKSYVGKGGLNRHYKLNPTHGKPDDETGNEQGDSFYSSDSFQSGVLVSNIENNTRQPKMNNNDMALEAFPNGKSRQSDKDKIYRPVIRGRKVRPVISGNADYKRRMKLLEASKGCTDEDILELFIQRCPYSISMWEILSLKNSKVYDSNVDSLLSEVTNLHDQISSYLSDKLVPLPEDDYQSYEDGFDLSNKNVFEMSDEKLAACLNLPVGKYVVKSESGSESSPQNPKLVESSENNKESLLEVTHVCQDSEQNIVLPPRKRLKIAEMSVDSLREQKDKHPSLAINNDKLENMVKSQIFGKHILGVEQSNVLVNHAIAATLQTKKPILDGSDDALVSSTSQVSNFFPVGDNSKCPNLTGSVSLASSLPDSSIHPTLTQTINNQPINNSTLSDIWSTIAKPSTKCHIASNSSLTSLNLTDAFIGVPGVGKIKSEYQQHLDPPLEIDPGTSQLPADSFSNLVDVNPSQDDGVCVTCFPMQEYIQVQENARYVQTEDGLIIVKNPDGSFQIYGNLVQDVTLEMLDSHFVN